MSNLDMMSNVVNDLLEMGDPAAVFEFDNATLLLGKYDANELSNSHVSTGQGKLKFPQEITRIDTNNCTAQKVTDTKNVLIRKQNENEYVSLIRIFILYFRFFSWDSTPTFGALSSAT